MERILLAHGDGGTLTSQLVSDIFLKYLANPALDEMGDAAVIDIRSALDDPSGRLAFTTDSFVVDPVFFPGGDIGKLAVCGTVNDLAVSGAVPRCLSAGFILEEGLPLTDLERIVASMAAAAQEAGVVIAAGDTKVVGRGSADKLFINTSGLGVIPGGRVLGYPAIRPQDAVLVSGPVGEHGVAVLSCRAGLSFHTPVQSDCAALNGIIGSLLDRFDGGQVRFMRDPTRGGLATTLKEIAQSAGVDITIREEEIPVSDNVRGACELLGLDPLYLANEGKFLAVVDSAVAEVALDLLRAHPLGRGAAIIGRISNGPGDVYLKTPLGGTKYLDKLAGEQLPRIC